MRNYSLAVLFFCLFLCFSTTSQASLTVDTNVAGDTVVFDDINNLYWYWDLSDTVNQPYNDQQTFILNLNTAGSEYYGLSGWQMASYTNMSDLYSSYGANEINSNFGPSNSEYNRWYGTYDELDPSGYNSSHYWSGINGSNKIELNVYSNADHLPSGDLVGAWITTSASSVPIPGAVWLLGSGLIGIAGVRRKFKK